MHQIIYIIIVKYILGMGGAINVSFTASVTIETSITEVGVAGTGAVEQRHQKYL